MTKYSRKLKRVLAVVLAFVMVASSVAMIPSVDAGAAPKKFVKSLKVSSKVTLTAGQKKVVKATVKTKGAAKKTVKVKQTKASKKIVSVKVGKASKKGVSKLTFTAKNVTATKTATVKVTTVAKNKKNKKITKNVKITVNPAQDTGDSTKPATTAATNPVTVASVSVSATSTSILVGASTKATATVTPVGANTQITWTTSNASIATVDQSGVIVGVNAGVAEITATASNGVKGSVSITVNKVPVTGVSVTNGDLELTVGATSVLKEIVAPSNATDKRVTWTSSDSTIVGVTDDGTVTAHKEGTAEITVQTVDGGFKAVTTVTVTKDSTQDVNGIEATVSNAMAGYENTVLVGERAKIDLQVTKNGAPFGGDVVSVNLKPVSGYTSYYELSTADVELNANGTGFVYVKLKGDLDKKALMTTDSDAAYASFELELTSGGANYKKTIPVSFAQIWTENWDSYNSMVVANNYDPDLDDIETNNSNYSIGYTVNKDGYGEEYAIEQQVSSDTEDHKVVFDAAPLLVRSAILGESNEDEYLKDGINFNETEYSVYEGVGDNGYTLESVPGGLEYLTLTFSSLKLSQYSRIVVRAYEEDTNYPLYDGNGNLIEKIITSDTVVSESTAGKTVQIKKEIFNETTANEKNIDIKIFIESCGQVNDDENLGYTLQKAQGPWSNQEILYYDYSRLVDSVEWKFGGVNDYTGEEVMSASDAELYLGTFYKENLTYKKSLPAFPDTGNAIIIGYNANGEQTGDDYYLYPTTAVDNENVLGTANTSKLFKATIQQIEELTEGRYTVEKDALGRCVVDSKTVGYVQLEAKINVFDKVAYSLYSSVHWSPLPNAEKYEIEEFYALTGQTVTLVAELKDKNENLAPAGYEIEWDGLDTDNVTIVNTDNYNVTDSKGQVTLTLKASKPTDVIDISIKEDKTYNISLKVAENPVESGHATIHWIKPGLYYAADVANANVEYDTSDDATTVVAMNSEYKAGHRWIIGTKVVGAAYDAATEVVNIENIGISMDITSAQGVTVVKDDVKNGVCTVYSENRGDSVTSATMTGLLDETKDCIITVEKNGIQTDYVNVGVGDIEFGAGLNIPITWKPNGVKLSWINENSSYDIKNSQDLTVYIKISDIFGNVVEGTNVIYKITDTDNQEIVPDTIEVSDANGLIAITIPNPDATTKYTIAANIEGDTERVTTTVDYVNEVETFTMSGDPAPDVDNNQIRVTFSQGVNKALVTKITDFFEITDGGKTVDIDNIAVSSTNGAEIIITTKQTFTSAVQVAINPTCEEDNVTYYFTSGKGVLFTQQ